MDSCETTTPARAQGFILSKHCNSLYGARNRVGIGLIQLALVHSLILSTSNKQKRGTTEICPIKHSIKSWTDYTIPSLEEGTHITWSVELQFTTRTFLLVDEYNHYRSQTGLFFLSKQTSSHALENVRDTAPSVTRELLWPSLKVSS